MGFQWDDKYSTGNDEIDNQHKQIFAYLDELEEHIEKGASQLWVENFMSALGLYTRSHFCYEEICMRQSKCAIAAKNKDQHAKLLAAFHKAEKKLEREGISDALLQQLKDFLTSWLVNHIMKIDIHLKACIK
ncbi:MAG: hemerythrin family protein [Ghiorsea sp.]|nr:hemerythrin family protein [Ghiorsea sp.]